MLKLENNLTGLMLNVLLLLMQSTPAVKRPSTYTAVHSSSRSLMAKSGQSQQHDVVKLPQIGSDSSKSLLSSVVVSPTSSHNTMDNHPIPEPEE